MRTGQDKWFDEHMPLGWSMGVITKHYYGALSKRVEKLGIDRHITALVVLHNSDVKCTQQCLSGILDIDKVTMVRTLDYLVSKGMIRRIVNPADRREHLLELTPKAEKLMRAIGQEISGMNRIALKGLSRNEQRILFKILGTIIKNVESLPTNKVDIKLKKKLR